MIYLNESGGRQEIWIPLKGKANGYNGTTVPLYQEITENGEYVWDRSNGYSPVTVKVDVKRGTNKVDVAATKTKLAHSAFETVPDVYDFSNCTDMGNMFADCFYLTSVPQLDTSKVTNMWCMFDGCSNLTSLPELDTSSVTDMIGMFNGCTNLTSVPQLDTSKVTNMQYMFQSCTNLTLVPQLDTSNALYMSRMFNGCSNLTSVPQLDTSKVTDMGIMFSNCSSIKTVPQMDTSKVTNMGNMFSGCSNLTSIPLLDTSKVTDMTGMFYHCSSLTSLTLVGSLNTSFELNYSPLNEDSIKSVLTAAGKTTDTTAKTLTFKTGSTLKDTDGVWAALISECTTKGWTIRNLTLV